MPKYSIGIDEAGRGPLAGSVFVSAVACLEGLDIKGLLPGVADSKTLSADKRLLIYNQARFLEKKGVLKISRSFSRSRFIDQWGISLAIRSALERSLSRLDISPSNCHVLLDGSLKAPDCYQNQETIIKGDQLIPLISLASIVAKVSRDKQITRLAKKYPRYNLEIHKGYGTLNHRLLIKEFGPSPVHRRSFCRNI